MLESLWNSKEQKLTVYTGKPLGYNANAQNRQDNQQSIWQRFIAMHKLAKIACYPGGPPSYSSIMVFNEMFLSVLNRYWLCSAHKIVSPRPPGPRAFGSASAWTHWAPAASCKPELQLQAGATAGEMLLFQWAAARGVEGVDICCSEHALLSCLEL